LPHSKVEMAAVIAALFPSMTLLAFMEDGHPADIPDGAEGVEMYLGYRAGGHSDDMLMRWFKPVEGVDQMREILGEDLQEEKVRGFAVMPGDLDLEELWEHLFVLVGMSTQDSPPARYQPAALPEVLERVPAVILIHRDKHGPALGVYSREPIEMLGRLAAVCDAEDALLVPFAIPPMLARWDRALAELREVWIETRDDEFPVPPSAEPSTWEPRWKRRQRRKEDAVQRRELQADSAEGELQADSAEGTLQPDSAEGALQADSAERELQPDSAEGEIQPDSAEGQLQPDSAEGQLQPDSAEGQLQADSAEGEIQPDSAEGEIQPDRAEGQLQADSAEE
ncbi:MAG: hypothetical protein JRS35_23765, partial [Deltaproteobacteria bacterium]|nr:hypothetical protein [Deltaproteobacteria bacterium]